MSNKIVDTTHGKKNWRDKDKEPPAPMGAPSKTPYKECFDASPTADNKAHDETGDRRAGAKIKKRPAHPVQNLTVAKPGFEGQDLARCPPEPGNRKSEDQKCGDLMSSRPVDHVSRLL